MNMGAFIAITVGTVSMFLLVTLKGLRYQPFYEHHRWLVCGGLAAVGLVFLIVGVFLRPRSRPSLDDGEFAPRQSPFLLASIGYWGFLFVLFGSAVALVAPATRAARAAEVRPTNTIQKPIVAMNPRFSIVDGAPSPAAALTGPSAVTNQLAKLKLQGIVYDKAKPSAIINGRTYFVGDGVRDARIVSIEPSEVVVELSGQKRTLRLGE